MIFDAPEYEDDTGDNSKEKNVAEVSVECRFHNILLKTKGSGGLDQGRKYPPTYGAKIFM